MVPLATLHSSRSNGSLTTAAPSPTIDTPYPVPRTREFQLEEGRPHFASMQVVVVAVGCRPFDNFSFLLLFVVVVVRASFVWYCFVFLSEVVLLIYDFFK